MRRAWFKHFGGDHLLREPLELVQGEGLIVEELVRSKVGIVERLVARKPRSGALDAAAARSN